MILGPFNSKEEAQSNGEKYGYTGDNYYVNSVNNEKMNQIIDEAYENYQWKQPKSFPAHPDSNLSKEEFINKCKTDPEFSEKWGLEIEERKLSWDERFRIAYKDLELRKNLNLKVKCYIFLMAIIKSWMNQTSQPN